MKIKSNVRAGGSGCSPETQVYMQKALNMQAKVQNCMANQTGGYQPPYYGYTPPVTQPSYVGSGSTYPDRSGWCG
jgi:hypothetical protein